MDFKFKPFGNPIMFVSDNPSLLGGLSRIGRDLATLTATLPQFRVGYLGLGLGQNRKLPFIVYDYPEYNRWGQGYLKEAWHDFAGQEPGIIMTLDDVSRRGFMVQTDDSFYGPHRSFRKWMYTPVDSTGPNGTSLPCDGIRTVAGFDRVMAASEWGCNVLKAGGRTDADWLPHGIWMDKFNTKGTHMDEFVTVGCVMANQSRKDFAVAFDCFARLLRHYGNRFRAWLHTDVLVRHWDVPALIENYGLQDHISVTVTLTDEGLAQRYRSCACTILPSGGEGFGFPIAESLACGTPCIVPNYSAASELVSHRHLALADGRIDGVCLRAVNYGSNFFERANYAADCKLADWDNYSQELSATVEHLDWNRLKVQWIKWMLEGLQ